MSVGSCGSVLIKISSLKFYNFYSKKYIKIITVAKLYYFIFLKYLMTLFCLQSRKRPYDWYTQKQSKNKKKILQSFYLFLFYKSHHLHHSSSRYFVCDPCFVCLAPSIVDMFAFSLLKYTEQSLGIPLTVFDKNLQIFT